MSQPKEKKGILGFFQKILDFFLSLLRTPEQQQESSNKGSAENLSNATQGVLEGFQQRTEAKKGNTRKVAPKTASQSGNPLEAVEKNVETLTKVQQQAQKLNKGAGDFGSDAMKLKEKMKAEQQKSFFSGIKQAFGFGRSAKIAVTGEHTKDPKCATTFTKQSTTPEQNQTDLEKAQSNVPKHIKNLERLAKEINDLKEKKGP